MSQSRQIFKNTAVLAISRLIDRASGVILAFFVSRILGATGLGIYAAAMAYYGLIAMAGEMGSTNLLVREIAKDRSQTNRYVVHVSVMATAVSAVVMVLSIVVVPYLGYSAELTSAIYLIILAMIPGTLSSIQEAVFVAHQRVEFETYTTFVTTIINIGISLYLLLNGYGIISLLIAFVITQYLVMICYFYIINRSITPIRWEFQLSFVLKLIQDIKAFAASSILGGLFARPEIIILSLVSAEAQIGFYSAALKVVDLWYLVPQTYMINIFPVLSRSYYLGDQKSQIIQDKSIKYLLALSLPLTVGVMVTAEPIVALFYGPGFGPSAAALRLLAWNMPLYCLHALLWRILAARGQQDAVLRVQVITIVSRLASGYLLIGALASLGAAIATPANLLLHTLLLALYIKRDGTPIHFLRLGWRFALAALGMGVLTWALSDQLQLWALVPLGAAIYMALVYVLKALSPDDFALFRKIWRSTVAERS